MSDFTSPRMLTKKEQEELQAEIDKLGWKGVHDKMIALGWSEQSATIITNLIFSGLWKDRRLK